MRKQVKAVLLLLCSAFLLGGCKVGGTDYVLYESEKEEDTSVFSLGENGCSLSEAMIYLCNYKNLYGNEFGIDLWESSADTGKLEQYIKDVAIQELTRVICMDMIAAERGIELTEKEQELAGIAAENYFRSLSEREIAFMQVTQESVQQAYVNYALANKLYDVLTESYDREVSDDEARVILAQQIFVESEETAMIIMEKLQNGSDFATVAVNYNEEPTFQLYIARGDLPDDVENLVYELDNGEYTDAVVTEEGFYFVKCVNKFVQDMTEANKDNIRMRRKTEMFHDAYEEFVSRTTFSLNEESWNAVSLTEVLSDIQTDCFFAEYDKVFGKKDGI